MINIVLCTDPNNLWGVAVTVRSAIETCCVPCSIHIIGVGLSETDCSQLRQSWQLENVRNVEFIPLEKGKLAAFRPTLYLPSKAAYARLYIADCLPHLSRCLYLDTDLIVCSDLQELYDIDLGDNIAACVRDICVRINPLSEETIPRLTGIGLDEPLRYFNSGVMLIDLEKWKKYEVGPRSIQIGTELYDLLDSQDQDILNIALKDQWLDLDVKWNTSQYEAPIDFNDGILHLIGRVKPWHSDYDYQFKNRFFDILDRTAYAGKRPADVLGLNATIKQLSRDIPTPEMLIGKLRRTFSSL